MAMPNKMAVFTETIFGLGILLNIESLTGLSYYWLALIIPIVFFITKNYYNELSKEVPLPADVYYFIE